MRVTLTSNHSFKIFRKNLSSSLAYSSSESSSSLSRCEDEDFRGTESNPSDVLWKHIDNRTWVKGCLLLNSVGVCVKQRGDWPLVRRTWSWRRRVSWWDTWCRPLRPLPPWLHSCLQWAAHTLYPQSYWSAWSIYTAACSVNMDSIGILAI